MKFSIDELLLIENLTYLENIPPLYNISKFNGKTINDLIESIDLNLIDLEMDYASFMTGLDFKNILIAIKNNKNLLETKIIDSHFDMAFGGGLGLSCLLINEKYKECVIAFRGTAKAEWTDDFLGANQIDSLQQINALEWYKKIYNEHNLNNYYITVTGHSKGGNKAKYITILNDTIDRCISFDGQGFSDKFIDYYKKEILKRQNIIENHNIDFDFVNILMNDVGNKTFYYGYGYGNGGFAESHCPNTFFNFYELGKYEININPNGQRQEMIILKGFINSMIRSAKNDKDRSKNNYLVGSLVEKAFGIGSDLSTNDFISYMLDMIGNPEYVDNASYLIAFTIKYAKENKDFLKALKDIMTYFNVLALINTIQMIEDIVNSKKLNLILGVSSFLVLHVNKIIVKKIKSIAKKNYDIDLSKEQISKALALISLIKEKLKTLEVDFNGSNIDINKLDDTTDSLLDNLNIVILAGGLGLERNISLYNGYMIYNELNNIGHNAILLDPYMGYKNEELKIENAFSEPQKYSMDISEISEDLPDLWAVKKRRIYESQSYFGPNVLQICLQADLVFIALSGNDIENGKIQSTFDLLGIDYTGNDYNSTLKTSNKLYTKELLIKNNIPILDSYFLFKDNNISYPKEHNIDYPVIIKTNTLGMGIGINICNNDNEFIEYVNEAFKWDNEIMIEKYIKGHEYSISLLNNKPLPTLEVLYLNNKLDELGFNISDIRSKRCPCDIDKTIEKNLVNYATKITNLLGLKIYSKIDFIVKDNNIYCINCDSSPKLSPYSHFSSSALEANIDYKSLLSEIIKLNLKKNIRA